MTDVREFRDMPMFRALMDLAGELEKEQAPPVELNVIGGFALMLRGYRDMGDITDIDYVGSDLSGTLQDITRRVGLKHGMEHGWINNEGMLTGDSMESFELSTGKLHFDEAFTVGPVKVNVLEEKDLLRLKIIAVDTAMTELEVTGEFARRKDFADIKALMDRLHMKPADLDEFAEYILCRPDTDELIHTICREGPEEAIKQIDEKCRAFERRRQTASNARSPFLDNLMDSLMAQSGLRLEETDLEFGKTPRSLELTEEELEFGESRHGLQN